MLILKRDCAKRNRDLAPDWFIIRTLMIDRQGSSEYSPAMQCNTPSFKGRYQQMIRQTRGIIILLIATAAASPAFAAMSAEELAKLAQNPIANLISVPFSIGCR